MNMEIMRPAKVVLCDPDRVLADIRFNVLQVCQILWVQIDRVKLHTRIYDTPLDTCSDQLNIVRLFHAVWLQHLQQKDCSWPCQFLGGLILLIGL